MVDSNRGGRSGAPDPGPGPDPFALTPPPDLGELPELRIDLGELAAPEVFPPGPLGLCPIQSVHFRGRGLTDPHVCYFVNKEGVTLHVGCDEHPETWVHVTLSMSVLAEMLALIHAQRGGEWVMIKDVLTTLGRVYPS